MEEHSGEMGKAGGWADRYDVESTSQIVISKVRGVVQASSTANPIKALPGGHLGQYAAYYRTAALNVKLSHGSI